MQHRTCDLAIVGGAVAGGALAATLRDSGLKIVLLEAQPKIPVINRGDQVAPPIAAYLDKIGVLKYFEARGSERVYIWRAYGPEGEVLAEVDLRDILPEPFNYILTLPHPEIQGAFMDALDDAPNVEVIRGVRGREAIRDEEKRIVGMIGTQGDDEIHVHSKVVAGCDGIRSLVRQEAGISTDITWLDEFPMITATRHPDQPADVNWEAWSPEGFLGVYPISKEYVRCPVQAEHGELTRWRQIGFDVVTQELAKKYPWFEQMRIVDEGLHVYKASMHNAESYVADNVVLIGEAAHTTPPFYGFGMAMAIRDGREAAPQIIEGIRTGDTSAAALKPYEDRVLDYNLFAIKMSKSYRDVATSRNATAGGLAAALETNPALDPEVMGRLYGEW